MTKRTRSASRRKAIFSNIREMILQGKLNPGDRLPSRVELEQRFSASSVTVQGAFNVLREAGFIVSAGRRGTFVSDRPPHLFNYGLVFATSRGRNDWSNFHTTLLNEAAVIETTDRKSITAYFDIRDSRETGGLDRLLDDVAEKRLAGMVVISQECFRGTPLLDMSGTPRVVLNAAPFHPEIPTVKFGGPRGFAEPAADYLLSRGRRQLAFVATTGMNPMREKEIVEILCERGIAILPHLIQCVPSTEAKWAVNLAQLFARLSPGERPNGVVIMDDNLVECFCAGLVAAGVRVPDDMEVVAHCNFPFAVPSVLPIVRLGYDLHDALLTCLGIVDRMRAGEKVEPYTVIKPRFESEIPKYSNSAYYTISIHG